MSRILIAAVTAATLLSGLGAPAAFAAGGPQHHEPPRMERDHQRPPAPHMERFQPPPRHAAPPAHRNGKHWGPGDRLPSTYAGKRHVIAKPSVHRLHPPARGQHWVRAGSDAVLVVSGSGIVVRIVPNLFR